MTEISISENSIIISDRLIAGDTVSVRLASGHNLPASASVRLVATSVPPPDACHAVFASDLISPDAPETTVRMKTRELREALRGAHVSESLPVVLEAIDEARGLVVAAVRFAVDNSAALWRGAVPKDPVPDPHYALAADLARHIADRNNPHHVTAEQVGAEQEGKVDDHNTNGEAHPDLREKIKSFRGVAEQADSTANAAIDLANHAESVSQSLADELLKHEVDMENPHAVTEAQVAGASTADEAKAFGRLASNNKWNAKNYFEGIINFPKARQKGIEFRDDDSIDEYDSKIFFVKKGQNSWSGTDKFFLITNKYDFKIFAGNNVVTSNCLCFDKTSGTIGVRKGNTYSVKFSPSSASFYVPVSVDNSLSVSGETNLYGNLNPGTAIDYGRMIGIEDMLSINRLPFGSPLYGAEIGSSPVYASFVLGDIFTSGGVSIPNGSMYSDYILFNVEDSEGASFTASIEYGEDLEDYLWLVQDERDLTFNIPASSACMLRISVINAGVSKAFEIGDGIKYKTCVIVKIENKGIFKPY